MIELAHVADMVWGQPWAIKPEKLRDIGAALERRIAGGDSEIRERVNRELGGYAVQSGWAVVPIHGTVAKRANLVMQASGGTSTDILRADLTRALEDPEVHGIVLDIDSPGGSVFGTFEAADLIFSMRGRKPVIAVANECACSAAYLLAAAADRVIGPATAVVGSIGVIIAHRDESRRLEAAGISTTLITAGRYKGAGHAAVPLSADGRASLQALADHYYAMFVTAIAKYRGVTVERVLGGMADGREWVGEAAVAAGLLDGLGTLADAVNGRVQVRRGLMTVAELRTAHSGAVAEIEAAAQTAAAEKAGAAAAAAEQAATTRERQRCAALAAAFGAEQAAVAAIESGQSVEAAKAARYDALAQQLRQMQQQAAERLQYAAPLLPVATEQLPPFAANRQQTAVPVVADAAGEIPEASLQAAYQADPALQAEFRSFAAYAAYTRAAAKGLVKIYGQKTG